LIRCERGSVVFRSPSHAKVQRSEIEGFRLITTIPLCALYSPTVDPDDDRQCGTGAYTFL
jgi:hypothetical protein